MLNPTALPPNMENLITTSIQTSKVELNRKKVEDLLRFSTGIYFPLSYQWFRRYSFLQDDGVAENCNPGQIAATKGN
jgi:hypothetical protein